MVRQWAISIRQPYVENIVAGLKAYEIRTRIPLDLSVGDELYVVQVGSGGNIVMSFVVGDIIQGAPDIIWTAFKSSLCVSEKEFYLYTAGRPSIFLLEIVSRKRINPPLMLDDLGLSRVPQWFTRVYVPHSAPPC